MGDGLPEQICSVCYNKLFNYYEFWKSCHSATEILLKEIHRNENIEMEIKMEYDDMDHNNWCNDSKKYDNKFLVKSIIKSIDEIYIRILSF